jgi:hypothetical protein
MLDAVAAARIKRARGLVAALPFTQDFLNRVAEGLDDLGLSA